MENGIEVIFRLPFLDIPVSNVVIMSWITMAVLIFWAWISTRHLKLIPTGLQNFAEMVVELLTNFVGNIIGKDAKRFVPYLGTVALFMAISNTAGALFMSELTGGIIGPSTRGLAIPAGLAILSILVTIGAGIWKHGIGHFLKTLLNPFNILELIIKPLSLSLRLFGNIMGAYLLMEMILTSIPVIFSSFACLYVDLFDGLLQAFVFTLLTSLYISEEVKEEE